MFRQIMNQWCQMFGTKKATNAELPSSYQYYDKCIMKELKTLTFNQTLTFCIWCASRLIADDKYVKDINQDEVVLLHRIIEEAWFWIDTQKFPDVDYVKEMRDKIFKIGPEDPVAAIETDPMETNMIGSVDLVLNYYLTKSNKSANSAAHSLINVIDYEADEAGNPLELETMLLFPAMRDEFERQLKIIEHLRTGKLEGISLQEFSNM